MYLRSTLVTLMLLASMTTIDATQTLVFVLEVGRHGARSPEAILPFSVNPL